MDFLTFASLFFISLLIVEKLILAPLDFLAAFQLPYWVGLAAVLSLFAWLLGE
jgi:hypothetical protein